jgi:hypothetical protein
LPSSTAKPTSAVQAMKPFGGTTGNDTLDGKGGIDKLIGGDGNDTYIYGTGYGNDTIAELDNNGYFSYGGTDQVTFTGLSQSAVKFQKTNYGLDLKVTLTATNETRPSAMPSTQMVATKWNRSCSPTAH